jgi:hypothetical protein
MSKTRLCIACEKPDPDITIEAAGKELPYHTACADELERDLRAIRDFRDAFAEALVARRRSRTVGPRADEI